MRGPGWFTLGLIIGVGVSAVCFLVASQGGEATIERTTKAGGRIGEGVVDLLETVNGGVERVASVVGHSVQLTSDEARYQVEKIGNSARRTASDVGRALTSNA